MKNPVDVARTRTVTWQDPRPLAAAGHSADGLSFLRRMAAGELPRPPIAELLDFTLTEADEGRAVFELEPAEFHYNPIGTVHGGVAATVLDSALGCAVHSTLPAGASYTTLELKVNMTRAIDPGRGRLRCEARVIHVGRTTAVADAQLRDAEGRLYAHATTTCLILRPQPVS